MKLIIVESPTKAKTISKYLDKKFEIRASVGHIRDLPKNNKKAIDIEKGFIPHYEISPGKEKVVEELEKLSKNAEETILATDPDREGEAIAWHIKEACGLKNPKRIVFHEITENAVKEALEHPRNIDENLRKAQEARRVLDRLVGYDLSGLIWKKVRYGLSAGRVQSPALRIIMEREREIRSFIPENYWVITGEFKTKNGDIILLICDKEPRDETEVKNIIDIAKKAKAWEIVTIKQTEVKRSPRPPFTTSTIQQTASSRMGFSPSRTMSIAQRLYEQGLITYMRTDSVNVSQEALRKIYTEIEKIFGKNYLQPRAYATKSKSAQEAHEAIRPTKIDQKHSGTNDEQKKLYNLIWERTIASQMADAKILRTKISANICQMSDVKSQMLKAIPDFSASGSIVVFPGWLSADPISRGEDLELPKLSKDESITLININSEGKQTEPPDRYTEAGLVKELEKREIGRPSTYASIIKTINDRGYVLKEGKTLHPTDTGDVVSTFLENNFAEYISDSFTAEMENKLDEIAEGKREYEKMLKNFYGPFLKEVKAKDKTTKKLTNLGEAPEEFKCPVCGGSMIIKLSKTGKFLSCAKFPECQGARKIDGSIMEGPKETGEICPKCGGKLIEREGRFGKFISCANYPKCKFIKQSPEEEAKKKTGIKCPECKEGEIIERRGRFGLFYSCSNYPKCKFAIKAKPTGNICNLCGSLMMEGTKTIPERCSNKNCPNYNPHKIKK
ncbi:MAG: topoisomerase protein [Candidatus Wolfebacteria bacterium GW2011_GWA2_42_10]|uniref:DNA topoisomerase 1 n=2 Tax=Candidatus Wolfeibacteriota TaxID=1752735 RepID=A0A0G0XJI2_9BACT|nr:MAG: topoisomerase protein [Candidatus Wolfebacteria bacterium GW2011_GWB1_41_12]KKS25059.1 MAG: topoisomerase protein [Candidatus Wolfebacteria bacterium GW2011_GWA2_42_10]KKT56350.1 MAG: topoisomerase protein [Candidatus Wolfebacteria bacterium GW2011_GWA1_44_24]